MTKDQIVALLLIVLGVAMAAFWAYRIWDLDHAMLVVSILIAVLGWKAIDEEDRERRSFRSCGPSGRSGGYDRAGKSGA